jgi:hypothetical protein
MESSIQESINCFSNFYNTSFINSIRSNCLLNQKCQSQKYKLKSRTSETELNLINPVNDINKNIGPNVNIKFPKKSERSEEQKEFFKKKISKTKKTEMCKNWELFGDCFYKDNCSFAHGELELRNKLLVKNNENQKYKTKPCRSFIEKAYCAFGSRCQYTHIVSDQRILKFKALNLKLANGIMIEAMKKENEKMEFSKLIDNVKVNINFKM